jgi:hypothetical protein
MAPLVSAIIPASSPRRMSAPPWPDTGELEKVLAPFRDRIVYPRAPYQWRGRHPYKLKTQS